MLTIRRAADRRHDRNRRRELWLTFDTDSRAPAAAASFGCLLFLNEAHLSPGGGILSRPPLACEMVTYVREGSVRFANAQGKAGVILAGEFQRLTAGGGVRGGEANASRTEWAHVFQIGVRPAQTGLWPSHEEKRFSTAERRDGLRVVCSPDARRSSLSIQQDALTYSAMLFPGQHIVHELRPGRYAWLHLVEGEIALGNLILTAGDGVGITAERSVSFTACDEAEVLLIDLGEPGAATAAQLGPPRLSALLGAPIIP